MRNAGFRVLVKPIEKSYQIFRARKMLLLATRQLKKDSSIEEDDRDM